MTNQQPPEFLSADCERVQDALFSQMETDAPVALNPDAQTFLELHLVHCAACRMYRQSMRHLQLSLQELELVETPAGLEDRIMGKIAGLSAERSEAREPIGHAAPRGLNWKNYAPLAAAVLVVAITVPLVVQSLAPGPHSADSQVAQVPASTTQNATPTQPRAATQARPEIATALPSQTQEQPGPAAQPLTPAKPQQVIVQPASKMSGRQPTNPSIASNPQPEMNVPGDSASTSQENPTDQTQLASAGAPQSIGQPFGDTYASENESDVYYDPVSTLVGF